MKYLFIAISIFVVTACCTEQRCNRKFPPQITETHDTINSIKWRDSLLIIPGDSSWIESIIMCDSLNNAYIKEIRAMKGQNPKIQIKLKDRILYVHAACDTAKILAHWKETNQQINETTSSVKEIKIKFIPGWAWFFIYSGMIFWLCLIVYILKLLIFKS